MVLANGSIAAGSMKNKVQDVRTDSLVGSILTISVVAPWSLNPDWWSFQVVPASLFYFAFVLSKSKNT